MGGWEGGRAARSAHIQVTLFAGRRIITPQPQGMPGREAPFGAGRPMLLPAQVVGPAQAAQVQAVGLLPVLVGAAGQDGLPAALGARLVLAGAEEHAVGVLAGHPVEELAQGLVALAAVAALGG